MILMIENLEAGSRTDGALPGAKRSRPAWFRPRRARKAMPAGPRELDDIVRHAADDPEAPASRHA